MNGLKNWAWHDTKHVLWLLGNCLKQLWLGNLHEARECLIWIKIHFEYEHERK